LVGDVFAVADTASTVIGGGWGLLGFFVFRRLG
jgi:hypothetical protein